MQCMPCLHGEYAPATLHLEAKVLSQKKPKSQTKFLMPQGHRFAARQCTCCDTLACRGTEVGNH